MIIPLIFIKDSLSNLSMMMHRLLVLEVIPLWVQLMLASLGNLFKWFQ